jgi:taurine dioxygenase
MDQATFSFSIKPLSRHTGAEIRGIDLSKSLDEATCKGLDQAFADYGVLAIRDQALTAPQFLEAMKIFGECRATIWMRTAGAIRA